MARREGVDDQALEQFVNQSPWDQAAVLRAYRRRMADAFAEPGGTIVIDDTSIPKTGRHSVGVASQWCGLRQKRTNCQVAVSLHYRTATADYPLALRLYLPESWTRDPDRLTTVGVPEDERDLRPKWRIALDLLDTVLAEDLPAGLIVADGAYGECGAFRQGLEDRGVRYIVGLMGTEKVTTAPPVWIRPRPGAPIRGPIWTQPGPRRWRCATWPRRCAPRPSPGPPSPARAPVTSRRCGCGRSPGTSMACRSRISTGERSGRPAGCWCSGNRTGKSS